MSDTPRTDAWKWSGGDDPIEEFCEFARKLERELSAAAAENTRIRAALASSKDPCVYCQLPKDEMTKCRSGFPGCARADDLMGCPELGASLNAEELQQELNEARTRIKELADIGGALADYLDLDDCECSDCKQLSRPVKDWQETVKRCLEGIE